MNAIYQLILVIFVVNGAWASGGIEMAAENPSLKYVEVSPLQHIAYDSVIVDPSKTTLIILPGIFRGLNRSDIFVQGLIQKKINFVTIHFSTQPASVATYEPNQKTYFDGGSDVTSKNFAGEVEAVVDNLKIQKPLVVTLSYSGTVSQHLNTTKFPVIVETAPLGRYDEDPDVKALNWLFPWVREWTLRNWAVKTASGYVNSDPRLGSAEAQQRMADGYYGMNKAVEGFDITKQDFVNTSRRVFIFGENEMLERKQNQLAAVEIYKQTTGIQTDAIIVPGAGHIVPNEQPERYTEILSAMITKLDEKQPKAKNKKK